MEVSWPPSSEDLTVVGYCFTCRHFCCCELLCNTRQSRSRQVKTSAQSNVVNQACYDLLQQRAIYKGSLRNENDSSSIYSESFTSPKQKEQLKNKCRVDLKKKKKNEQKNTQRSILSISFQIIFSFGRYFTSLKSLKDITDSG